MGAIPPRAVGVLEEGISVGPPQNEGGVGGLGSNNRVVEARSGNSIEKKAVQEGEDLVVIVGTSIVVQVVGQGVSTIGGSWFMEEVDVVVAKGQDVVSEAMVDFLGATIVLEVLVVGEDIYDELGAK